MLIIEINSLCLLQIDFNIYQNKMHYIIKLKVVIVIAYIIFPRSDQNIRSDYKRRIKKKGFSL